MPEEVAEDAIKVKVIPKFNEAFSGTRAAAIARSSTPGPRS